MSKTVKDNAEKWGRDNNIVMTADQYIQDLKAEIEKQRKALDIILTGKLQTPKGLRAFVDGWVDCEFEYAEAISKALKEE